jgi:hypothetical protein
VSVLLGVLALIGILVVVAALVGFGIAAMKRDSAHGTSGSLSTAMTNIESLFHEGKHTIVEAMHAEREDERDTDGDPPER